MRNSASGNGAMDLPDKFKLVSRPPLANGKGSKKVSDTTPCPFSWNSMRSSGCTRITCDGSDSGSTTNGCSQGASTSSAGATSSHTAGHDGGSQGTIQDDACFPDDMRFPDDESFRVANEEPAPAGQGGELAMDARGTLSLTNTGEIFVKVPIGWDGEREIFSVESQTYPQLLLAVDTTSPNFTVKGMTKQAMGNINNSYWKYIMFDQFPHGAGYFALQYMGTHFGNPNSDPRYFVIENNATFRIADRDVAEQHGCLGYIPS